MLPFTVWEKCGEKVVVPAEVKDAVDTFAVPETLTGMNTQPDFRISVVPRRRTTEVGTKTCSVLQ